ncbi:hypothetical protein [Bradyrhizobium amphicarpaeae]|uniref:hypothetical protein n=1 Tax=Bradyrhizobium amphicarpaeae TaxID=1404768 RepID=UPI0011E4CF6D|nr:hypothetical protein [Bradyrhizobium amphicarpaeae]
MNRKLTTIHSWLSSDSPYFLSFHPQIRDHSLLARDNVWDQQRIAAENTVNPIYFTELKFAALSLDQRGLTYYGAYCVVLREQLIQDRASVFEENPFVFNPKHHVFSSQQPPLGYRATWLQRGMLAEAKLAHKISPATRENDFITILMGANRDDADCDFIEVHIYGMLHKRAIERVVGPNPTDQYDRAIWNDCKRKLKSLGATVEEI